MNPSQPNRTEANCWHQYLHQLLCIEALLLLQGHKVDFLRRQSFICEWGLQCEHHISAFILAPSKLMHDNLILVAS